MRTYRWHSSCCSQVVLRAPGTFHEQAHIAHCQKCTFQSTQRDTNKRRVVSPSSRPTSDHLSGTLRHSAVRNCASFVSSYTPKRLHCYTVFPCLHYLCIRQRNTSYHLRASTLVRIRTRRTAASKIRHHPLPNLSLLTSTGTPAVIASIDGQVSTQG